jgi:hypothetical protein
MPRENPGERQAVQAFLTPGGPDVAQDEQKLRCVASLAAKSLATRGARPAPARGASDSQAENFHATSSRPGPWPSRRHHRTLPFHATSLPPAACPEALAEAPPSSEDSGGPRRGAPSKRTRQARRAMPVAIDAPARHCNAARRLNFISIVRRH